MLGLLVDPSELPAAIIPAVAIGLVLLLAARPLSVLACLVPFRVPWREQGFISWAGLRGAVPIVLATFPIVEGVSDAGDLLNIVFVLVVIFTVIQGPSLPAVARLLGLTKPDALQEIQVETAPLDTLHADLLTVSIPAGSRLQGVAIFELRLPPPTAVTLIIRDGTTIVPGHDTVLRAGDELLLITTPKVRQDTERRLRAVGRRGKLARWLGEHGDTEPIERPPPSNRPRRLGVRPLRVCVLGCRESALAGRFTGQVPCWKRPCRSWNHPPRLAMPGRERLRCTAEIGLPCSRAFRAGPLSRPTSWFPIRRRRARSARRSGDSAGGRRRTQRQQSTVVIVPLHRSDSAYHRLLGALVVVLLLGCVSGVYGGSGAAMASACPPQASHHGSLGSAAVEWPALVPHDMAHHGIVPLVVV